MRPSRAHALAVTVSIATVALTLAALVQVVLTRVGTSYHPSQSLVESLSDAPIAFSYALVGVIVILKRPGNLVGWALVLAGFGLLAAGVAAAYGEVALLAHPTWGLPGGAAVAAVSSGSWTALIAGVFLLLVTFPSGTIASRMARRWIVTVLSGLGLVWLLITLSTSELEPPLHSVESPLVVPGRSVLIVLSVPIIVACLLSVVVAGIDVVRRFRRSAGLERLQFRWLAFSATLLVLTLPFGAAFNWSRVVGAVVAVALVALPVSVGVAVLRYRLYEIDRIVSRTLSYALLTIVLGAGYVGLVLAGQAIFSSFAGGGDVAIAVSTLVVATLFLPVRSRLQGLMDRRFYRRRYDAQRTLQAFAATMRDEIDLEALTGELSRVVTEAMQPTHVMLWRREAP